MKTAPFTASVDQFLQLRRRRWDTQSRYDSIILAPTGAVHDSGYGIIAIIGCRNSIAVEVAGDGCCDDILAHIACKRIRIDCLWPSLCMRLHGRGLEFHVGNSLSTTQVDIIESENP